MPVRDAQATQWGEEEKRAARYQAAMHVCLMQCVHHRAVVAPSTKEGEEALERPGAFVSGCVWKQLKWGGSLQSGL